MRSGEFYFLNVYVFLYCIMMRGGWGTRSTMHVMLKRETVIFPSFEKSFPNQNFWSTLLPVPLSIFASVRAKGKAKEF